MSKVYIVKHIYDEDGGYGDAIGCEEVVAVFLNEVDAEAYCNKYSNPHCYDTPYNDLFCGKLIWEDLDIYDDLTSAPPFEVPDYMQRVL